MDGQLVEIPAREFDGVVFDMDGVVTDTATLHRQVWKQVFDAYLRDTRRDATTPFTEEDYLRHVDGRARNDGVSAFLASRGISLPPGTPTDPPGDTTVWALANRKDAHFHTALEEGGVRAFPSSVELIHALQVAGFGTAIVSASRNCAAVLRAAGLPDLFPVRVDGLVAEALRLPGKPDPALFLEAAERLGVAPARAVVVEDALSGVRAGRAGGFGLVIGVARSGDHRGLRDAGADVVVDDLAQVAVA